MKVNDLLSSLEAQILLAHVLGVSRSHLYAWPETVIDDKAYQTFLALMERSLAGEPIAYLTGMKEFWSLPLKVTPQVLIPRPETETLVESALAQFSADSFRKVLDLGTGSGAIALALAKERMKWEIWAVDCSKDALAIAKENAKNLSLLSIQFVESHWFDALKIKSIQFDLIVANPPYIDILVFPEYEDNLRWEPKSALIADDHGLADLKKIIKEAKAFLLPKGWLMLEHGFDQGAIVAALMQQAGFSEICHRQDLAGHNRVTLGQFIKN